MSALPAPPASSEVSRLLIAAIAFLVGILVGWRLRAQRSEFALDGTAPVPTGAKQITVKSFNLTLKCTCGETYAFHDGFGRGKPGSVPLPADDSYTCLACGKAHDLKELRRVAREAGASL